MLSKIKDDYAKLIIRPPRHRYAVHELGPKRFRLDGRSFIREDLELTNSRGHELMCSHFLPARLPNARRPCVVYLHGNCSSRCEACCLLPFLLWHDLTVFCLDLSGSGLSGGKYISLGWHEEQDLLTVLQHLRSEPRVAHIGLWGRSMGAATAVLRASQDGQLAACVLDSTFASLKLVSKEVVERSMRLPKMLVNAGLSILRSEVRSKADFDLLELEPAQAARKATCPALFGVAEDDMFVQPHHTRQVYDAWGGEKMLFSFSGGHNGQRPTWFHEEGARFLAQKLYQASGMDLPPSLRRSHPCEPIASAPPRSTLLASRRGMGAQEVPVAKKSRCLGWRSHRRAKAEPNREHSPCKSTSTTASEGEAFGPSNIVFERQ